mgnify:CR=1 FL=1
MEIILEYLKSVLFGIVQGITEWLPISSTGHLILLNQFTPLTVAADPARNQEFFDMFKVLIQFGSILAVVVLYFHKLNPFSPKKTEREKKNTFSLWGKVLVASVPAGIIGILFNDVIDSVLSTPYVIAATLILYGVLFLILGKPEQTAQGKKSFLNCLPDGFADRRMPNAGADSRHLPVRRYYPRRLCSLAAPVL